MAPLTEEHNASIADFVPGLDRLAANGNLLLSPAGAGRLVAAGVDRGCGARERASDHAPVWIELTDARSG